MKDATPPQTHSGQTAANAPLPDMDMLAQLFASVNRPLGLDELLRILRLPRNRKKSIVFLLEQMENAGTLLRVRGQWAHPPKRSSVSGILSVDRNGTGFVALSPPSRGETLYIHPSGLGEALDGDTVEAIILPGRKGPSREGRIIAVTERSARPVPVLAIKEQTGKKTGPPQWAATPLQSNEDRGTSTVFMVDTGDLSVTAKDLLLVQPTEKIAPGVWQATALANLHNEDTPAAQELLVKSTHGIATAFPKAALDEASALPPDPDVAEALGHKGRQDLTAIPFVTIDGPDARDFDDAIHVELADSAQGPQYILRVAIADVAHYVPPGSALDREALARGNSCYFPLSVEPMLPETLSNGLCSLLPERPRLVMVAEMAFTTDGQQTAASFYPAIIISKARLTYGQVFAGLVQQSIAQETAEYIALLPHIPMLEQAFALADKLSAIRKGRGSLAFDMPEPMIHFNEDGSIASMGQRPVNKANALIEEFMLAANEAVATSLTAGKKNLLYRVHEAPAPEKLASFMAFLAQGTIIPPAMLPQIRGTHTPRPQEKNRQRRAAYAPPAVSGKQLALVLNTVHGTAQEYTVSRLLLRAMMQARYSPKKQEHFGLASPCYCHFTSPIRRYADLVTHRALKAMQGDGANEKSSSFSRLESIADQCNSREKIAVGAERETHKRLSVLYMREHIGEVFDGIVSGVAEFGIFVTLTSCLVEGMIRLSSLEDDFYDYIETSQSLRGRRTGLVYSVGQPLQVEVTEAHLHRLEITLVPAGSRQTATVPDVPGLRGAKTNQPKKLQIKALQEAQTRPKKQPKGKGRGKTAAKRKK